MEMNKIVLEAIALRKCLEATYNRTRFRMAPYILYTRHDELYIDAVALERDGRLPRELKMGTFKLAGMSDLRVSDQPFEPDNLYNPRDEKYAGTTLFAIELG